MRPRQLLATSVILASLAAALPSAAAASHDAGGTDPVASSGYAAPQQSFASTPAAPAALPPGTPMSVLQLNLCNSGVAGCYEGGQSVPEAYGVITSVRPDVVTLDQCNHLMRSVIPSIWSSAGAVLPSVVGGDFNLKYQGSPNVQNCVPGGWYRKGDGDVQHVMATTNLPFGSSQKIGLSHTDHPGWLVRTTVS